MTDVVFPLRRSAIVGIAGLLPETYQAILYALIAHQYCLTHAVAGSRLLDSVTHDRSLDRLTAKVVPFVMSLADEVLEDQ
jgi:hypothetical protein